MIRLFFSYSHEDEELRDELQFHLEALKHEGIIETFHDRLIGAGDELHNEISENLEKADIILLLVSSYFIASEYCIGVEMKRAMERHDKGEAIVIPVILRPCDWHHLPFGKRLLVTPPDGKPVTKFADQHDGLYEVAKAIRAAAEKLATTTESTKQNKGTTGALDMGATGSTKPIRTKDTRSGNLRVKKRFTDQERDQFLEEAFEYIANYFENSLEELERKNADVQSRFRRLDSRRFTATAYRNGERVSGCRIWIGGLSPTNTNAIGYSVNEAGDDRAFNAMLSIEDDGYSLFLKPMLGIPSKADNQHLTNEGGAEYFWSRFMEPLQQ